MREAERAYDMFRPGRRNFRFFRTHTDGARRRRHVVRRWFARKVSSSSIHRLFHQFVGGFRQQRTDASP